MALTGRGLADRGAGGTALEGTLRPPPGGDEDDDSVVYEARPPEGGPPAEEERRRLEEEDRRRERADHIEATVWAVMGALVVLYLFFAVLGAIDPAEAPFATFVIALLALAWLAHAWDRLYAGGHVSRSDRERRGF
jgi:hypothetical protein